MNAGRYRLIDVVRSEWTKFVTLRSTRLILVGFVVTGVALGVAYRHLGVLLGEPIGRDPRRTGTRPTTPWPG